MGHSQVPHAIVEITEKADQAIASLSTLNDAVKAISASEAFRKYNWLKSIPVMNAAGDLRGMVVSSRWRTVFQVSGDVGGVLEKVAVVAGLAVNIVHSWNEIETIYNSQDPWDVKGAKLSSQVSSVAIRTVGGIIPAGFSLLALSMQGYCQAGGVVTGSRFQPQACIAKLKAASSYVNTTFNNVTDGDNIYSFLNVTITPRVNRLMGY